MKIAILQSHRKTYVALTRPRKCTTLTMMSTSTDNDEANVVRVNNSKRFGLRSIFIQKKNISFFSQFVSSVHVLAISSIIHLNFLEFTLVLVSSFIYPWRMPYCVHDGKYEWIKTKKKHTQNFVLAVFLNFCRTMHVCF